MSWGFLEDAGDVLSRTKDTAPGDYDAMMAESVT
jgi:hypothetical protein